MPEIQIPYKLAELFAPKRGDLRYRVAHGGRGSGKSYAFALMALLWGYAEPLRILCTRELQVSIKESMHAELKNIIEQYDFLKEHYDVGEAFIRGANGTEFLFRGLRHNVGAIKSMAQIDLCIVEEAADVPQASWQALLPTIRAPKSEIWVVYNPKNENDPVDVMFRKEIQPRAFVVELNYCDNPFFPPVLEEQRKSNQEKWNPADYAWIWEGAYLTNSESQVFSGKWRTAEFEPKDSWDGPYQGGDFGYAQDPTAAVRCYIHGDTLYISHEAGGRGIELDDIGNRVNDKIPDYDKYVSRWDSASPGSISIIKRNGIPNAKACAKWQGSVDDGIRFMRSFKEIVIHPRCKETINEFRLYSYKVDRLTGDVLPVLVDANNHYCDSIRYALSPLIKGNGYSIDGLLG